MESAFALHGLWLFVARMAVVPVSGWAIFRYYRLARTWLAESDALDHRLSPVALEIRQSLLEQPDHWHRLDPFCLAFSPAPIAWSHQAPLRLWLSDNKRMSLDGQIERTFTALETARLRAAVADWSRYREKVDIRQVLTAPVAISKQDDELDETVRWIIRSFKEHPERWCQYRHQVVYSRHLVSSEFSSQIQLWTSNGVNFLEMDGRIRRRFSNMEKAAIWSAYSSWRERTKALRQRNDRRAARSVFR